jgi:hypothetical protein
MRGDNDAYGYEPARTGDNNQWFSQYRVEGRIDQAEA